MVHALRSCRVITPHGEPDAAVIIDAEQTLAVEPPSELSPTILFEVLGNLALLPVLVHVHIHISEPGRTEQEGFATAARTTFSSISAASDRRTQTIPLSQPTIRTVLSKPQCIAPKFVASQ